MYSKNSFENYPVFINIIKKYGMSNLLDPLTKTILRGHMMTYVDSLIKEKVPFALTIIDIDNFKQINDNYGHHVGDLVLQETAMNLIDAYEDYGIVGRFGGDEFIIVDLVHTTYDSIHSFLQTLYMSEKCGIVFRRDLKLENLSIYLTGTIGTANFPNDATDYDELFNKADKALYRGKMKGRNCFIIYVDEKHKDIDITKLVKHPIQDIFYELATIFEKKDTVDKKLTKIKKYFKELRMNDIYLFDKDGVQIDKPNIKVEKLDSLIDDENNYSAYNSLGEIVTNSKSVLKFINDHDIASILIGNIIFKGEKYGYLIFSDSIVQRIWQNEDIAMLIYVARLFGMEFYLSNNK